jgi:hypothetical protein
MEGKNVNLMKKSEGEQLAFEGLRPVPTPAQEVFCQAIASGKSRKDAFKAAWPDRTYQPKNIGRVMNHPIVVARLNSIRADIASLMLWDRYQSIHALKEVVDANRGSPAIVAAVRELNEMHKFNAPIQVEVGAPGAFDVAVRIIDKPAGDGVPA